jgi:hypothetical protein
VAVFTNKSSLETFSKISEILMTVHGIKVKILKTNFDLEAFEMLQQTWVKIYGLPTIACKEDIVKKVATLAGGPLVVDELSLIKTGLVHVKMNVRDPFKLRGFVRIFFNLMGYNIRFLYEKYKDNPTLPPSPPHRKDHDEDYDDNVEEDRDIGPRRTQEKGKQQKMTSEWSGKSGGGSSQQDCGALSRTDG